MKRNQLIVVIAVISTLSLSARADLINYKIGTGSSVTPLSIDPGLVIQTAILPSVAGHTFTLDDAQSETFDFFDIWTNETAVNLDDLTPYNITAMLDFASPPGSATVSGETVAFTILLASTGLVSWSGPQIVNSGGVSFSVELSDESFNTWFGTGLRPGRNRGATVQAIVTQIDSPSSAPPGSPVPAPAAPMLMMMGLSMVSWMKRRLA